MNKCEPMIVKGDYMIELLKSVHLDTLYKIRSDFGEPTFPTVEVIRLIEKEIGIRESKRVGNCDTISEEEPDFTDF
jgi:hypothetical protein